MTWPWLGKTRDNVALPFSKDHAVTCCDVLRKCITHSAISTYRGRTWTNSVFSLPSLCSHVCQRSYQQPKCEVHRYTHCVSVSLPDHISSQRGKRGHSKWTFLTYSSFYICICVCHLYGLPLIFLHKQQVTPRTTELTFRTERRVPRLGVMLVGWGGNNGTTVTAAVLANKLGLTWRTKTGEKVGGVTQTRL